MMNKGHFATLHPPLRVQQLKAERDAWREAFEILARGRDGSKR